MRKDYSPKIKKPLSVFRHNFPYFVHCKTVFFTICSDFFPSYVLLSDCTKGTFLIRCGNVRTAYHKKYRSAQIAQNSNFLHKM